jgi:hypothetical protein
MHARTHTHTHIHTHSQVKQLADFKTAELNAKLLQLESHIHWLQQDNERLTEELRQVQGQGEIEAAAGGGGGGGGRGGSGGAAAPVTAGAQVGLLADRRAPCVARRPTAAHALQRRGHPPPSPQHPVLDCRAHT